MEESIQLEKIMVQIHTSKSQKSKFPTIFAFFEFLSDG